MTLSPEDIVVPVEKDGEEPTGEAEAKAVSWQDGVIIGGRFGNYKIETPSP